MWCMRWQRQTVFDTFASGDWSRAFRRSVPSIALSTCLLASVMLVLAPTPAPAEGELVEGGDVVDIGDGGGKGMPATNPRVKSLLAAHPGEFVTICVAGCAGKPSIVQMLPMPMQARRGEMRTTAGTHGRPAGTPSGISGGIYGDGCQCRDVRCRMRRRAGTDHPELAGTAAVAESGTAEGRGRGHRRRQRRRPLIGTFYSISLRTSS